jgi:hypothetical protein
MNPSQESILEAKSIPLNEAAIRSQMGGGDMTEQLRHTTVRTLRIGSGAKHTHENPKGKGTHIFQVVAGGPISVTVTGKTARFREPFSVELGKTEERTGGGSYPWSFTGNHLIIEDAVNILVTLSAEADAMPTVYTVIQVER